METPPSTSNPIATDETAPDTAATDTTASDTAPTLARRFGVVVRRLRNRARWSQEEFAFQVGIHRTYIGAIERGEKTVTIETAAKIARALGMPLSQLFVALEEDNADN